MKDDDDRGRGGNGTVAHLLRETADGMGRLVIQHLKLAQLELTADLRAMGSRVVLVAVYVVLMVVGYMLTMTGVALLIARQRTLAWPFLGLGLLHVVGTGVGILLAFARVRRPGILQNTTDELNQSAATLIAAGRAPASGTVVATGNRLEPVSGR